VIGWIAQWASEAESLPGDSRSLRLRRRLRWALLRFGDPPVTYRLGSHSLRIPLSHEMPGYRRVHPTYDSPLGVLAAALVGSAESPIRAIDVGANVGDSAVVLIDAGVDAVLCVEGLDTYLEFLRVNVAGLPQVVIAPIFVTERVEALSGSAARGTAVLSPTPDGAKSSTFADLLAQYPNFAGAELLKIDTDGWDLAIIKSASEWLSKSKATVFFEYDPVLEANQGYDASEVWQLFGRLGYPLARMWSNTGIELWAGTLVGAPAAVEDALKSYPYVDVMVGFTDPLAR
jgi:FkbM family methyltransferase